MREIWIVSNVPPPVHGVSAFNAVLRDQLRNRGVTSRIFRVGTRGALTELERMNARKLVCDAGTLARLALAEVRRKAPDHMIYFTPSQGGTAVLRDAMVARIARVSGTPLVGHIHGCAWLHNWERGGWRGKAMLDALRGCARIICLGTTYAQRMATATGLPCVGVNNGVIAPVDEPVTAVWRPGERIELLYLSSLSKSKGLWIAARALRELRGRGLPARLRCAGLWGRERERIEFQRDFGCELADGTIELVGFADRELKQRLFREARFFVLPTEHHKEGQPLSLIEAMASGVLPVTTRQGAITDLFEFEGWEELARPEHRDPIAVAATIESFARDQERYQRASGRCIARHRQALAIDRCVDNVLRILIEA